MKYEARVTQVVRSGIHTMGVLENGTVVPGAPLPLPDRVEIVLDGGSNEPCMLYRYTDTGQSCGDTWHETLEHAFSQAEFEYGLSPHDFRPVETKD
jgi:hypothetical protein